MTPPTVPEEIRRAIECLKPPRPPEPVYPVEERRWKRDCEEYDDLVALIATALAEAERRGRINAIEECLTILRKQCEGDLDYAVFLCRALLPSPTEPTK